jgi:sugar (pentulose or hexulose) kinase
MAAVRVCVMASFSDQVVSLRARVCASARASACVQMQHMVCPGCGDSVSSFLGLGAGRLDDTPCAGQSWVWDVWTTCPVRAMARSREASPRQARLLAGRERQRQRRM